MNPSSALSGATRHASLRWIGAPLFFSGIALLVAALISVGGEGSGWNIPLGLLSTGMGLASFGANHDAAIAFGTKADRSKLPKGLAGEVEEELERDRAETLNLRPSPKVAMVLPLVAIGVQAFLAWRLFG